MDSENQSHKQNSDDMSATFEYWQKLSRNWGKFGPPLRPSAQDAAFMTDVIKSWASSNGAPRALILGVTPELYHMSWPDGTDLLAVDHNPAMIENVWPGPRNMVICDEWLDMPLEKNSRDIALCDGGISVFAYPHEHQQFVPELHRIIKPNGLCMFRLFVPQNERQEPDKVLQDLIEGKIPDLNHFKLRIWGSMYNDTTKDVQLKDVWDAIHSVVPDLKSLAVQLGWPTDTLFMIDAYRNNPTRFFFPNVDDVSYLFCKDPGGFEFETVHVPKYDLGKCCPSVVFRRIDADPI
jgi:SAM-dependent methyltransferase